MAGEKKKCSHTQCREPRVEGRIHCGPCAAWSDDDDNDEDCPCRERHARRERIASACLAGLASWAPGDGSPQDAAKWALARADALAAMLDAPVSP